MVAHCIQDGIRHMVSSYHWSQHWPIVLPAGTTGMEGPHSRLSHLFGCLSLPPAAQRAVQPSPVDNCGTNAKWTPLVIWMARTKQDADSMFPELLPATYQKLTEQHLCPQTLCPPKRQTGIAERLPSGGRLLYFSLALMPSLPIVLRFLDQECMSVPPWSAHRHKLSHTDQAAPFLCACKARVERLAGLGIGARSMTATERKRKYRADQEKNSEPFKQDTADQQVWT